MSHGNSAVLSISAARGAIRTRASVRTRSRISRCSSESGSDATSWSLEAVEVPRVRRPGAEEDVERPEDSGAAHRGHDPEPEVELRRQSDHQEREVREPREEDP